LCPWRGTKYPRCCLCRARKQPPLDNSKKCSSGLGSAWSPFPAPDFSASDFSASEGGRPGAVGDARQAGWPSSRADLRASRPLPSRDGKLGYVSTEVMPDSDLKVHEDLKVDTSHGDHERFAHYVDKNDMMQAAVFGTPIKALCGKVWVPSRDPQKFPVCPECKEIYESLPPGDGDENE
jgi:Protein of unknown function (DUF3039)